MPFASVSCRLNLQQDGTSTVPAAADFTEYGGFFMRELNNTKIIAVDHGYGNIKTANTVTPTALTAYDSEPVFSGNILEYNGTYYRIGEGRKEFIPDKAADEDYYILTLMAVARELNLAGISEADVHLAAGLPLTWVRRQREEFRNYLLRNEDVQFKFKRKGYRLHFTGCSLYPQGYPAVVNRLNEFKGTNLLADIGNGTMNILYIVDKKPVESRSWTEKNRCQPVHDCRTECRHGQFRGKD